MLPQTLSIMKTRHSSYRTFLPSFITTMDLDDQALVASVLAFLDEFYASSTPQNEVKDAEVDGSTAGELKSRRDSNRARNEALRELLALRAAVPMLEHELQLRRNAKRLRFSNREPPADASSSCRVWKETAVSQLAQRVRAETENRNLRARVEEARRVLWGLRSRLHGRSASEAVKQFSGKSCWSAVELPTFDSKVKAVIEDLSRRVDAIYADTVLGLREVNLSDPVCTTTSIERGLDRKFVAKRLLPFSVQAIADATWEILNAGIRLHATSLFSFRSAENDNDSVSTVVEYFGMKLAHEDTSADFRVSQVMRRYTGTSREVIIWESIVDTVAINDCRVEGAAFRETGRALIRPIGRNESEAAASSEYSASEISYVVETPTTSAFNDTTDISGFILRTMALNLSAKNLQIENLLLSNHSSRNPATVSAYV